MTKQEVINILKNQGLFELTGEVLTVLKSDSAPNHEKANRHISYLIENIAVMYNWLQFDAPQMLDFVTQAYGFEKGLAYSDIDAVADISEPLEDMYHIIRNVLFDNVFRT